MTAEMQECIQNCLDCHRICLESVTHCLEPGGKHAAPEHIRMLLDCAEICRASADFMLRGARHHHDVCGVCAAVCRRCAESCRAMAGPGTRA